MTNWFVNVNGEQKGPYPTDQLRKLVSDGLVARDTYVWCEGMSEWQSVTKTFASDVTRPVRLPPPANGFSAQQAIDNRTAAGKADSLYIKPNYFSLKGRINRKTYFFSYVLPWQILFNWGVSFLLFNYTSGNFTITWIITSIGSVMIAFGTAKRLHDMGFTSIFSVVVVIPVLGPIFVFMWCLFLGVEGKNRYGADPLS